MIQTVNELRDQLGVAPTCRAMALSRATYYRNVTSRSWPASQRPKPPRALSNEQRQGVLEVLHEPRFVDVAPAEVHATLLDEGQYLCSERTMYRILAQTKEVRERRDQRRHPVYRKPELLATAPNQVWSWDITKLLGPVKWTYFYLYVILDIFSRYVLGWMLAGEESSVLAKRLIEQTCLRQAISASSALTIHADRGPSMTANPWRCCCPIWA